MDSVNIEVDERAEFKYKDVGAPPAPEVKDSGDPLPPEPEADAAPAAAPVEDSLSSFKRIASAFPVFFCFCTNYRDGCLVSSRIQMETD